MYKAGNTYPHRTLHTYDPEKVMCTKNQWTTDTSSITNAMIEQEYKGLASYENGS